MRKLVLALGSVLSLLFLFSIQLDSAAVAKASESGSSGYRELPQSNLYKKSPSYISLQELVDDTPAYGQLTLEAGDYSGPVTITKPMEIIGQGAATTVHIEAESATIILASDQITLKDLVIDDKRENPDEPVIVVKQQRDITLEGLQLKSMATAIKGTELQHSTLTDNTIEWKGKSSAKLSSRGNGIYLFNSSDIAVLGNTVSGMYDGIYTEGSKRLLIQHNEVRDSRYAYHMMYAEQVELLDNTSEGNIIGLMIMTSDHITLQGNKLLKQQDNANAGGILIYDVVDATVFNNEVIENRIGINIERSEAIQVQHNRLLHNFVALQLQKGEQIKLENNDFIGNVTNIWDDGSSKPIIQHNYWDTHQGLDSNGDGYSDLTYASSPFFLSLIERRPSFQLLFGTPGISFIEQLYAAQRDQWIADQSPSMSVHLLERAGEKRIQWGMLLVWTLLGAASTYMMLKLRRREQ